jgi:hypothetical protein
LDSIEDDLDLAALKDRLAAQARGLNRVFARAFGDMLLGKTRSLRDVGRALKAQNQCRIALRLLLALGAEEQAAKKSRNRTNKLVQAENRHHVQDLGRALLESLLCAAQAHTQELAAPTGPPTCPRIPGSSRSPPVARISDRRIQKGRGWSARAPFALPL